MALGTAAAATYILLVTYSWQPEEIAATNIVTCQRAAAALKSGLWVPTNRRWRWPPRKVACVPGNRFAPGYDKIKGFNS